MKTQIRAPATIAKLIHLKIPVAPAAEFALPSSAARAPAAKTNNALHTKSDATMDLRSFIEPLEKELGTFVISSLQASLWKALQILKYQVPVEGYGRLLRDLG